jgi:hypothetical protein
VRPFNFLSAESAWPAENAPRNQTVQQGFPSRNSDRQDGLTAELIRPLRAVKKVFPDLLPEITAAASGGSLSLQPAATASLHGLQ